MHDLAEVMEKLESIKELKEKLVDCFKAELSTKGMECVNTEEAGQVVDMIKDLAETERNCMEALYYQKVTEAMVNYEEPRYGYNSNRASNGRYTTKGSGMRMGFRPHVPMLEYDGEMGPNDYIHEAMMGYDWGSSGRTDNSTSWGRGNSENQGNGNNQGTMNSMGYQENMDPRYGRAYNEYKEKRRHYDRSRSPEDKREMSTHAEEHVHDTLTTIRDIWKDADPDLKKRMKEDFSKLVSEMTV